MPPPAPGHTGRREDVRPGTNLLKRQSDKGTNGPPNLSPALNSNAILVNVTAGIVTVLAVSLSLYQLYTAGIAALTALVQRSIHLGAILSLRREIVEADPAGAE